MISKKTLLAFALTAMALASCGGGGEGGEGGEGSQTPSTSLDSSTGTGNAEDYGGDFNYAGILRIYYHRDDGAYSDKKLWVWGIGVDGNEIGELDFANASDPDEFGVYCDIDLGAAPWNAISHSSISFIVKKGGTWDGQSTDTICAFNKFQKTIVEEGGKQLMTVYAIDNGDSTISTYNSRAEALGDRIGSAAFIDWKTIRITGTGTNDGRPEEDIGKIAGYTLYGFDHEYYLMDQAEQAAAKESYVIERGNGDGNVLDLSLPSDAELGTGYVVEATFQSDPSKSKSKAVSFVNLYDTDKFNSDYTYDGDDLGVSGNPKDGWSFKLWAPTAYRVQLYLYIAGTPSALTPTGNAPGANNHREVEMLRGDRGVWYLDQAELDRIHLPIEEGDFYTYAVTNSEGTVETSDPYAHSSGINGERSCALSKEAVEALRPEGFGESIASLPKIEQMNDLFIYETHVRDVTSDKTWISNEGHQRGTFAAFAEKGTTYSDGETTVTTGLDSILELGVNAIQLLPVFDQDNDEREVEGSEFNGEYNWGYNPKNYNFPDGAYSSDPYSSTAKITEFMGLVKTLAESGVRTIMDVVYNHLSSVSGAAFTKIMPKYYFRTNESGAYVNGSGTGNVTASERTMMRNFIVDSVVYWAEVYGIKGFRFDLMGCIDLETMKAVRNALNEIDPTIAVYGEGWNGAFGGDPGIDDSLVAMTGNVYSELYAGAEGLEESPWGVGAFNDHGRDGLKGNTQWEGAAPDYGFISQGSEHLSAGTRSRAASSFLGSNEGVGSNPTQTINYASCHDNYTLYDQMNYCLGSGTSSSEDSQDARDATIAVTAAIVYSQGAAFIHGGEEIFRQKVMEPGDPYWDLVDQNAASNDAVDLGDGTRLMRNSYTYGDEVNSYKYDRKIAFRDDYNRYKEACLMRTEGMDGGYLGRAYDDETWAAAGCSLWGDYRDEGGTRTVAAANFAGLDGSADRYVAIAGRDPSDAMRALSIGTNRVKVVYSSTGYHEAGEEIATTDFLQLGKYEMVILEKL